MKYSELHELRKNVNEFAEWLNDPANESRIIQLPAINLHSTNYIYEYEYNAEGVKDYSKVSEFRTHTKMRNIAKALGSAKKTYSGTLFQIDKVFGKPYRCGVTIGFSTSREAICRKVVTGTKVIPARTETLPERIEEEVEWVCDDPLLAAK